LAVASDHSVAVLAYAIADDTGWRCRAKEQKAIGTTLFCVAGLVIVVVFAGLSFRAYRQHIAAQALVAEKWSKALSPIASSLFLSGTPL
jgi:hypothetical protein